MTTITRFSVIVLLLAIQANVFAEDAIRWAPDLETARAAATRNKQLIYIHFYGDDCPPCRRLEANVFSKASFAQSLEADYVPVKINGSQQTEIAKQFGVDRWPQDVIITPAGQFVYRTISPQDEGRYVSMLAMVSQKANPKPTASPEMVAQTSNPTVTASMQVPVSQPALPEANQGQRGSVYSSFTANNAAPPQQQPAMQQSAPQQVAPQLPPPPTSRFANSGPAPSMPPAAASDPAQSRFSSSPVASQTRPGMPAPPAYVGPAPQQPAANQVVQQPAPQPSAPGQPVAQQPPAAPAVQPKFAMDGYCPVTLMESMKWQKGDPRWGAQHQGQIYLFSSQVEQQKFLANPNQYSPVMSGIDPVAYLNKGQTVPGDRRFGLTHRGTLYLFSSEESLQTFWKDPTRYSAMVQQAMAAQNMHR
ncbi:DUF255 domain-containing protein [Bremerella cremea]|uniref:DUF255 domain-containing protein n=1 Tax=Bremerella cremea TaxID=1031537 RepID=A0A368KZ35_9BACT|nr:thioredoxin family protein [Bremerella cremea]RCS56039.1 DUF255 domain-containing protein [Bremerella cremea]